MKASKTMYGGGGGWATYSSKAKEGNMQPATVLADDFETWWSSFNWKWVPGKKEKVDLQYAIRFSEPVEERVAQRIAKEGLSILPITPPATPSTPSISWTRRQVRRKGIETPTKIPPPRKLHPALSMKTEYFEIKKSGVKGYGAFAIKDIPKGTIIMTESPLFRSHPVEVMTHWYDITREQRLEYATLACYEVLDPSNKIMAIYKTNRFETTDRLGGIFLRCSRFNHACHPHATCKYRYDEEEKLIITACHDIKEGQEITISYTTMPLTLPEDYGFYCDCPGCPPPAEAKRVADFCKYG